MQASATAILFGCLFLLVIVLVEHLTRRWMIPSVGWVLLLGLAYGLTCRLWGDWLPGGTLSAEIVVYGFLPLLIFSSSRKLHIRMVLAELPEIGFLSLVGPLVGMLLLALPLVWLGGISWLDAMLFGVALSATDPLAVGALLRKVRVPRRLLTVIEGESLFNDAVVVVIFTVLSASIFSDSAMSVSRTIGGFLYSLAGAVVLGVLAGGLGGWLLRAWHEVHDRFIGALLPLIIIYGAFALAHSVLHVSGVVAVVAATLTLGSLHIHCHEKTDTQRRADDFFKDFWGFLTTLANAILFFGIGVLVGQHEWLLPWILVPAICAAMLISRPATVYPLGLLAGVMRRSLPVSWLHMISASGLRGGLSVALLMSLPTAYPHRIAMLCLAFALLLFTTVAHLATMRLYLHDMNLESKGTSLEGGEA